MENVELSCPEGFIGFDNRCYFYKNIKVLLDIIDINSHLTEYHPLLLGYQLWEDGYLVELNLDGFGKYPQLAIAVPIGLGINLNVSSLDWLFENE